VLQIVSNCAIHLRKRQRWKRLNNFFRRSTLLEADHHRIERYTSSSDLQSTILFLNIGRFRIRHNDSNLTLASHYYSLSMRAHLEPISLSSVGEQKAKIVLF